MRGYAAFLWEMYAFLGGELKKRGIILQLHLAVQRNVNTRLFREKGADCGGDCIGDPIPGSHVAALLDEWHQRDALPRVILYTLNTGMTQQLASIAGSFPGVRLGAAWWFADHQRGIAETIRTIAEIQHIGGFLGMLTDSRSFLSYARHDYFRRILAGILANGGKAANFRGTSRNWRGQFATATSAGGLKRRNGHENDFPLGTAGTIRSRWRRSGRSPA